MFIKHEKNVLSIQNIFFFFYVFIKFKIFCVIYMDCYFFNLKKGRMKVI
jgi:hypothetical protein